MQAYEQSKKTSSLSTLHILERMLVPGQQKHITSLRSVLGNMQRGESNSDQISQAVDGLLILWAESPLLKEELLKIMRDFLAFCRSKKEPILEKIQGEMACRIASMKPEDTELLALFIPDDGHYPDGVLRHAISANNLRALAFLVGDSSDKLYLAFSIAISLNNADAIEFILPKLNLDAALNTAVREDNPPAIKLLLQKGANPNSALDTVISTDNLGTLELLLKLSKHFADPYLALDIALNLDKENTANFILQYIDDLGLAFNTAVEEDNPRVMNFLLEHGVNPNFALSTAMRSENLGILGLLLQKGADPNAALTMAIRARKEFTIKFLLESSGINPNHKNSDDRSLLSIAIEEASNDPTAWRVVLSLLKPDAHVEETEHLDSKVLLSWLFLNEDPNKPTADDIRYLQQCGLIKPETLDKMLSEVSELLLNSALERLPLNNQFLQLKGFLKLFPGNKSESSSLFKTLCDLRVITDDTTIQTYSQRLRDTATRLLGAGVPLNNDWAALLKMALFTEDAALIKVLLAQAKDNAEKQSEKYLLSGGDLYKAIDIKGLGRREIIDLFVENIDLFDPEWINTYGYIAIRLAIQHDDLETIKQLLVLGANIEPPQTTPLVLYVADDANQALEKIKLLLDYGADPRPILAMPLICKQLLKVKSWSECIFHYEHVKAHKRLEYRYDDTSLLHELSYEDKEPWINKLSKILKAPLPSKPLWYEKTEREIVSLLLEKIKNHHDPLQFVAIAIAMEKTFHDAEIDIPENIQTILNQLKACGNVTELSMAAIASENRSSTGEVLEFKEDERIKNPSSNSTLEELLLLGISTADLSQITDYLAMYPIKQAILDKVLKITATDNLPVEEFLLNTGRNPNRMRKLRSIAKILLEAGANPRQKIEGLPRILKSKTGIQNNSLLLSTVCQRDKALVELLLDYDAGNAIYDGGRAAAKNSPLKEIDVALAVAVLDNQVDMAKMLLSRGANIHNTHHLFNMPLLLHVASQNKVPEHAAIPTLKFLLHECGIDPRIQGPKGETLDETYKKVFDLLGESMIKLVFNYEFTHHSKPQLDIHLSQQRRHQLAEQKRELIAAFTKSKPFITWSDKDKKMQEILTLLQGQVEQNTPVERLYEFAIKARGIFQYAKLPVPEEIANIFTQVTENQAAEERVLKFLLNIADMTPKDRVLEFLSNLPNMSPAKISELYQVEFITPQLLREAICNYFSADYSSQEKKIRRHKILALLKQDNPRLNFELYGDSGYFLLQKALQEGDLELTEALLKQGANLETPQPKLPLLFEAALCKRLVHRDRVAATKLLLEYGANPNEANSEGRTIAELTVYQDLGNYLIRHTFDYEFLKACRMRPLNSQPIIFQEREKQQLKTALSNAKSYFSLGFESKIREEIILGLRERIDKCTDTQLLPLLEMAARKAFKEAKVLIPDDLQLILAQLQAYQPVDSECSDEKADEAARPQEQALLKNEMNAAQKDKLLLSAMRRGDSITARRMLAMGADPNIKDESGASLLLSFAHQDIEWGVRLLLAYGANPWPSQEADESKSENDMSLQRSPVFQNLGKTLQVLIFEHQYIEKYCVLSQQNVGEILDWTKPYDQLPQESHSELTQIPSKILQELSEKITLPRSGFSLQQQPTTNHPLKWVKENFALFDNHLKLQALQEWLNELSIAKSDPEVQKLASSISSILERVEAREDLNRPPVPAVVPNIELSAIGLIN